MAQLSLKRTYIAPEAMDAWKMLHFPFWGPALFFRDELLVLGRVTIKINHSCTYIIYYKNLLCKMDPMVVGDEEFFLYVVKNAVFFRFCEVFFFYLMETLPRFLLQAKSLRKSNLWPYCKMTYSQ